MELGIDIASLGRALLFMGLPFIFMIFYFQYKWAKTCEKNIQVLVAQKSGGGAFALAPKEGGEITITNTATGDVKTWPVNELATIEVTYPGVGFLPKWMQKNIRLAIVNEGDWEPMLNRSPHRKKIASPDVVDFMRYIAEQSEDGMKEEVNLFLEGISTGSTREMIADPSTLGTLMKNGVLKALAQVSNDLLEQLKSINTRLSRMVSLSPTVLYIALGLIAILCVVAVFQIMSIKTTLEAGGATDMAQKVNAIYNALGIKP